MNRHPAACVCTPCCDRDVMNDNPIHDNDRQEALSARMAPETVNAPCYRHDYRPDGHGGGVCECGDYIGPGEL